MLATDHRLHGGGTMLRAVSAWHIAIALATLSSGCFLAHDRAAPGPSTDAGAGPVSDAGATGDVCAQVIARIRAGESPESIGCGRGFLPVDCVVSVGECCVATIGCDIAPTDGGHVTVQLSCDDSCDQGCAAQRRDDCGLFPYCQWFDEGACGPGTPGAITGPVCAPRRRGPCDREGACEPGQTCRTYWVNPCAGMACDACGGEASFCSD